MKRCLLVTDFLSPPQLLTHLHTQCTALALLPQMFKLLQQTTGKPIRTDPSLNPIPDPSHTKKSGYSLGATCCLADWKERHFFWAHLHNSQRHITQIYRCKSRSNLIHNSNTEFQNCRTHELHQNPNIPQAALGSQGDSEPGPSRLSHGICCFLHREKRESAMDSQ